MEEVATWGWEMWALLTGAVILVIGIFRVLIHRPSSTGDWFMEFLLLDLLFDLLSFIFQAIAAIISDS